MTDNAIEALKAENLSPTGLEAVHELEDFLEEALQYLQYKTYYDQIAENAKLIVDDDQIPKRAAHIKNVKEVMDRPPSLHHGDKRMEDPVTRKDLRNQLKRERERYDELLAEHKRCNPEFSEHDDHGHAESDLGPADTSDLSSDHMHTGEHAH